jgi:hypothetical protein
MASRQSVYYAKGQISLCRFLFCYFHLLRVTVQEAEYESNQFWDEHVDRTARCTRWDHETGFTDFCVSKQAC